MMPVEFREVRDSVNKDRLLGRWYCPPVFRGEKLGVAVMPPAEPHKDPCTPLDIRRVEFRLERRPSPDHYDLIGFLTTSAPLEDLYWIKGFALPGETLRDAEDRQHWRRL